MRRFSVLIAGLFLAIPTLAAAQTGLVGDCYDCHTMHNSEQGAQVALVGSAGGTELSANPIQNLLKFDCIACHANDPTGGTKLFTMTGGSTVPQVMHGGGADALAGGNFAFGVGGANDKVHNVVDLFAGQWDVQATAGLASPPGIPHSSNRAFSTSEATPFDEFTCAGARGCHGTRSQLLSGETTNNTFNTETAVRRTGIAAVSGAHHNNFDGAKSDPGYTTDIPHDGTIVAAGYRFIPGLWGYENTVTRWQNVDETDHNEYYGSTAGSGAGCSQCHIQGHDGGLSSRAAFDSTIALPNNSMSGFCATCHGNFHASGDSANGDFADNGTSGAFLRHPSDYIIPESGEYAAYDVYDITAPVARPTVYTAADSVVTGGTDMVMCLSCHQPHGTANDYLLRFDYATMTSGGYATITDATTAGGCLACHTTKGVLPENR